MSKYRKIETQFKSEETFRQALADVCREFGVVYESHEVAENLIGYVGKTRKEKAEYIIRRKHLGRQSNDLGFARTEDGTIEAIISNFDNVRKARKILNRVTQRYARLQVEKMARARGMRVEEIQTSDGSIRLRLVGRKTTSRRTQIRQGIG